MVTEAGTESLYAIYIGVIHGNLLMRLKETATLVRDQHAHRPDTIGNRRRDELAARWIEVYRERGPLTVGIFNLNPTSGVRCGAYNPSRHAITAFSLQMEVGAEFLTRTRLDGLQKPSRAHRDNRPALRLRPGASQDSGGRPGPLAKIK